MDLNSKAKMQERLYLLETFSSDALKDSKLHWPYIRYNKKHKCKGWIPEGILHSILADDVQKKIKPPTVVQEGRRSIVYVFEEYRLLFNSQGVSHKQYNLNYFE
jgi:hypothetical protein